MKNLCTYDYDYDDLPFYCMSGVKEVVFNGETVPYVYNSGRYYDIFYSMNNLEIVYVPAKAYSDYIKLCLALMIIL